MEIKYYGAKEETGLTLKAHMYDQDVTAILTDLPMTEVGTTSIYKSDNMFSVLSSLAKGLYTIRIESSEGEFLGHSELAWDGTKEASLSELEKRMWTKDEKMQIRDSLGVDGDKLVARNGQLQKKSESPDNDIIDTTEFKE